MSESSGGAHRHDTGHPAHGPETTEPMTFALQGVLGMCIAVTIGLVLWAAIAAV